MQKTIIEVAVELIDAIVKAEDILASANCESRRT
jgi:hypothetical protein